jgi:hypothetical protein
MGLDSTVKRRWFGGIALFGAIAMLICGETVLKTTLGGGAYLVYWLICFIMTGLAIVIAFMDVRALQHRIRAEHRDLIEGTIERIQSDAKEKRPKSRAQGPKRGN